MHPTTKTILIRCAQPNKGIQGKRSDADERLLPYLAKLSK